MPSTAQRLRRGHAHKMGGNRRCSPFPTGLLRGQLSPGPVFSHCCRHSAGILPSHRVCSLWPTDQWANTEKSPRSTEQHAVWWSTASDTVLGLCGFATRGWSMAQGSSNTAHPRSGTYHSGFCLTSQSILQEAEPLHVLWIMEITFSKQLNIEIWKSLGWSL